MNKKQLIQRERQSILNHDPAELFKKAIFDLNYYILKSNLLTSQMEVLSLLIQMFQLLSFVFNHQHLSIWKDKTISNVLIAIFNYSLFIPLIRDNATMFFILFYGWFIIISINLLSSTIAVVLLKQNNIKILFLIRFLFQFYYANATFGFLPFIELFSCIFANDSKTNSIKYVSSLQYRNGINTAHSVIGGLGIMFLVIFSFTLRIICYEVIPGRNRLYAKMTSKCDIVSLAIKILIVLCFNISYSYFSEDQWITLIVLFAFALILLYMNYLYHPYYSSQMTKIDNGCLLIFLWGTIVGLIGKWLNASGFNGSSELFLICCPLIIVAIYFNELSFLKKSSTQNKTELQFIMKIYEVISLIEKRFVNREMFLKLYAYLFIEEIDCIEPNCALKKYFKKKAYKFAETSKTSMNEYYVTSLLYQYIDILFFRAFAVIPYCSVLHFHYAFFLMSKMGKYDKAYKQLIQATIYSSSFEEEFNAYRIRKSIEENDYLIIQSNDANKTNANIISYFFYSKIFTDLINQTTNLYISFWSLMIKHSKGDNSFFQLNQIGSEINFLLEIIKTKLNQLQKLKPNDASTLTLYSQFLSNVLHDKEESEKINSLLNETTDSYKAIMNESLNTIDISVLSSSPSIQFIVASTEEESFCKIIHLTTEVAGLFGYSASELLNRSIEVLLPEIVQKSHTSFMRHLLTAKKPITNSLKINQFNNANENQTESKMKMMKEIIAFAKTKSHYLLPLNLIVGIMPNEKNENVLFAKVKPLNFNSEKSCFIMTDARFFIHYYTANTFQILSIQTSFLNERTDITNNIKEIYEEFFTKITSNQHGNQDTLDVKTQIIKSRFSKPTIISWKETLMNSQMKSKDDCRAIRFNKANSDIEHSSNVVITKTRKMTVSALTIGSMLQGYIFQFDIPPELIRVPSTWFNLPKGRGVNKILSPTYSKNASFNNSSEIGDKMDFDSNYLPEKHKITFDPIKLRYSLFPNDNSADGHLAEYMKNKVLSKIDCDKKDFEEKSDEESSSSYSESHDIISDDNEYKEDDNDNKDNNNQRHDLIEEGDSLKLTKEQSKFRSDDEYYKVNVTKIKLSIYNFKKKMALEIREDYPKNQVQLVLDRENKSKKSSSIIEEINPELTTQILKKQSVRRTSKHEKMINQVVSKKTNEFASKRNRKDFAVILLEIFLISAFIVILFIGLVYFNEMNKIIKQMNTFTVLIREVLDLCAYCICINFYAVEYILINNEKYTNYYFEKSTYKNFTRDYLFKSFNTTLELINSIYSTYISISDEAREQLDETYCLIKIIDKEFLHNLFNVTLYTALIEGNTAQYNLASTHYDNQHFLNVDMHYIFFNLDNATTRGLNQTFNIYFNEQDRQIRNLKVRLLILIGIFLVILIIVVLFGKYCVNSVLILKEKYFEVFCRLSEVSIKTALDKCEAFYLSCSLRSNSNTSKIYSDDFSTDSNQLKVNKDSNGDFPDKRNSNSKYRNESKDDTKFKRDKNEVNTIIIVFWVFNLIILCVCAFMVFHSWYFFDRSHDALSIYNGFSMNEYTLLRIFQYLQAYIVLGTFEDSYSFDYYGRELKQYLATIYFGKTIGHSLRYSLINNKRLSAKHNDLILKFYFENLCFLFDEAIQNELKDSNFTCESFANNSTAKGFEVILNRYTDSIQAMESITENSINKALQTDFYFNELYYGTPLYFIVPPWNPNDLEEYNRLNPFYLFNEEYMKELTMQTIYLVIPGFSILKNHIIMSYRTERDNYALISKTCMGIYYAMLIGFYAFYFVPKEKKIKVEVI